MPIHVCIISGCFHTIEWSGCSRNHRIHKAKYLLDGILQKCLLTLLSRIDAMIIPILQRKTQKPRKVEVPKLQN